MRYTERHYWDSLNTSSLHFGTPEKCLMNSGPISQKTQCISVTKTCLTENTRHPSNQDQSINASQGKILSFLVCGNKMPTRCNTTLQKTYQEHPHTTPTTFDKPCNKFHKNLQNYFLHFYSTKYHRQQPLYNTLELLMMDIEVSETC